MICITTPVSISSPDSQSFTLGRKNGERVFSSRTLPAISCGFTCDSRAFMTCKLADTTTRRQQPITLQIVKHAQKLIGKWAQTPFPFPCYTSSVINRMSMCQDLIAPCCEVSFRVGRPIAVPLRLDWSLSIWNEYLVTRAAIMVG